MTMTRKHFKVLAANFLASRKLVEQMLSNNSITDAEAKDAINHIKVKIAAVMDACKASNERFNEAKFMQACGF